MTPDEWQRLKPLFEHALELPPEQRSAFVDKIRTEDDNLASRLLALIRSHEQETASIERPLFRFDDPDEQPLFSNGELILDRFRIVRFIARGGMGEVYEAFDTELREPVALKTIRASIGSDPRATERFRQEVRRARAITSRHVCRVHDLFTHRDSSDAPPVSFLSMRLLHGETLHSRIRRDGKLCPDEALPLLRQIAEGVDAAHRERIVHGDLKSGNIMLIPAEGGPPSACITDFGLARRIARDGDDETQTEALPAGGTPAWMAPEQMEGRPTGPESDIYAFGLIAYEMVTGRLPFDGQTPADVARRRLTDPPHPARQFTPELTARWEQALTRCLDRDPEKRFATGAAFLAALESGSPFTARLRQPAIAFAALLCLILGTGVAVAWQPIHHWFATVLRSTAPDRSVAVLPFQRLGPTPEYFSDGFTEELMHALGQVRDLRVLGPESSFRLKGSQLSPREIGHKLGVRYLLIGSVRRVDNQIRVIARLIDADGGGQVWSRDVTRNERDVLLIRDDIARMLSSELNVSLAGPQTPAQTIDAAGLSARDLYWTGRLYFRQRTDEGVRASLDYFRNAVVRDPSFALAYCGLADALFVMAEGAMLPQEEALAQARQAAHTAVQLDQRLPEAWTSLAQVTSIYDRNLDEAERFFRRALALDPKSAGAWQWYSYQLVKQRRFSESVQAAEAAVAADPLSLAANINLAVVYLYSGSDDRAVQQCRKLSQMDPQLFFEHPMTAIVFARKGLVGEALHEMESIPASRKDHAITMRVWVEVYALAGMREQANQALERLLTRYSQGGGVPPSYVAAGYAAVGDKDRAIEWLARALAVHDAFASVANAYPAFDSIRSDPRYAPLMIRLGIKAQIPSDSSRPH
jgi:serine/threonine-protein kinase